jgi:hypothetical protein
MPPALNSLLFAAMFAGPFLAYLAAARWPYARRWHLVAAATIGAGIPAAIWAASGALVGLTISDTGPVVLIATAFGAFIGLCGIAARSLGPWLSGRPD